MKSPLYKELISHIKKDYQPNQKLPSERELVEMFKVSRSTVRLALNELEEKGLIYRLHGKGTFVAPTFIKQPNLGSMYSFSSQMEGEGKEISTKNISLKLCTPEKEIALQLNLASNDQAYELIRLRLLVYNRTYLPEKIFPNLTLDDLNQGTLYGTLKKKYHQISVLAFEDVQTVNLTKEAAQLLHVKENTVSLKINRKAINDKNIPIEFTQALARGDKFVYRSKQYNE
ncbi:GntR family transcriptional regulator [Lactobacillus gallinarum]|uniref:GntR family transcriptional regulator n=1 Tax=Lactobacillus gallinarum TaxID=52242 RepID=UPI0024B1AAFE|nr:GntR family transcriptional regulator [Lactobacillus gallinarum]